MSWGMGLDSTALLLRWILEPQTRDFELDDLALCTSMTGNEFFSTYRDVTQHVLPVLREHNVRFVQITRSQRKTTKAGGGVVVLDDSRQPQQLHIQGQYTLADEMLAAGTIPQLGGIRTCSIHSKGECLDPVIAGITAGNPFRQATSAYSVYEVRRLVRPAKKPGGRGIVARSVKVLATGTRTSAEAFLTAMPGHRHTGPDGIVRHHVRQRDTDGVDHLYVAAPPVSRPNNAAASNSGGATPPAKPSSDRRPAAVTYRRHHRAPGSSQTYEQRAASRRRRIPAPAWRPHRSRPQEKGSQPTTHRREGQNWPPAPDRSRSRHTQRLCTHSCPHRLRHRHYGKRTIARPLGHRHRSAGEQKVSTFANALMWVGLSLCVVGIPIVLFSNPKSYLAAALLGTAALMLCISAGLQLAANP